MSSERAWPIIRWRAGGEPRRVIVEDFHVEIGELRLTIPAGFDDFDGASIPRWLWNSVGHPFMREFERAALVHDYFYIAAESRRRHGIDSRARIDALFYELLVIDGVSRPKAKCMFWAVERFGEPRFVRSDGGYIARTQAELDALDAQDCSCAKDEIRALLAAGGQDPDQDPELLQSFREIDWGLIRRVFGG